MVRLSVNINKVALIRNSRGSNLPDLVKVAKDCEQFGAQGITVHPRPDERHVHYADVPLLKEVVKTEFNIEGNPTKRFMDLVLANKPHQCTLVPDDPGALTSDEGWDTKANLGFLQDIIGQLHEAGIRTSIFLDPDPEMVDGAVRSGTDRVELYTGAYAKHFVNNPSSAVAPFAETARYAEEAGLGINAGHDLNLDNLRYFKEHIPGLLEVSIGHALVCDALYYGLENVIPMYLQKIS